jgi:hypothetical protein
MECSRISPRRGPARPDRQATGADADSAPTKDVVAGWSSLVHHAITCTSHNTSVSTLLVLMPEELPARLLFFH